MDHGQKRDILEKLANGTISERKAAADCLRAIVFPIEWNILPIDTDQTELERLTDRQYMVRREGDRLLYRSPMVPFIWNEKPFPGIDYDREAIYEAETEPA